MTPDGDALIRWTARLAVALYTAALAARLRGGLGAARILWTAGCAAYFAHMAAAFHFAHGWSHAAAYEATARQSAASGGPAWGGGVWCNYLFALTWAGDAAWWWVAPRQHRTRPTWVEAAVQGYLAFIAFNAAVVFASGPARWLGVAACSLVAWAWRRRRPALEFRH